MFEKFQEIATEGCRASAAFVINNKSYIAFANEIGSASSVVYKRAGMHFVKLQNLQKHRAMDIQSFYINDDVFLAIASQPVSYINKWSGRWFVQFKTILTSGARALHPFVMGGQTFLGVADQYRTKTELYRFSAPGQFTKYQELSTHLNTRVILIWLLLILERTKGTLKVRCTSGPYCCEVLNESYFKICFISLVLILSTQRFSCFDLLFLLVLEFMLSSRIYLMSFQEYSLLVIVRCQFFIGGRAFDVRADHGSLVSFKFLFGFVNLRFSFSLVCSFLPIETNQVQSTQAEFTQLFYSFYGCILFMAGLLIYSYTVEPPLSGQ